jgi:molybdopterin-guanine dinucleotide biosynthesis protein A
VVGGVLLTGGASRRLGTDKATIVFDGETLAARAARVLAVVCDPVVEVGPGVSGLRAVREDPPGAGPLAALVAGADALGRDAPVLLLACDMPFVDVALLELLATWPGEGTVVPVAGERVQYTCARYGTATLDRARTAMAEGGRALKQVVDGAATLVDESQWRAVAPLHAFADVDTPDDLARWRSEPRR